MAPSQPTTTRDSRILIVGAGVFRLSTALELARQGYTNVKVLIVKLFRHHTPLVLSEQNCVRRI